MPLLLVPVRPRRRAAVPALLAATVAALWLNPAPAAAHDALVATSPTDQATTARTPEKVVLTLEEPAIALGTQVVVTGPDGPVQAGAPRLVGTAVQQDLRPGAPAGRYTVAWRVTSDDGHPVSGTFTFTSSAAGAGQPSGTTAPVPAVASSSTSPWGWVAAGLVVVAVGLLGWRRARSEGGRA